MASEETRQQELSRVASKAAEQFGLNPPQLKKAIEEELQALVAKETAEKLFKERGGKPQSFQGHRPR